MSRFIDGKSFLVGGLLVAVVVCAMGGLPFIDPQYNGRYMLVAQEVAGNSSMVMGGNLFIIDTATGQVWRPRSRCACVLRP